MKKIPRRSTKNASLCLRIPDDLRNRLIASFEKNKSARSLTMEVERLLDLALKSEGK